MKCAKCGNKRYAEWCPYCDTETPPLPPLYQPRQEVHVLGGDQSAQRACCWQLRDFKSFRMASDARKKLRELAMAAIVDAPSPWEALPYVFDDGSIDDEAWFISPANGSNLSGCELTKVAAAYIAAAHPGVMLELLDALEKAEKRSAEERRTNA